MSRLSFGSPTNGKGRQSGSLMLTFVWIRLKITLFSYPAFLDPFFKSSVALYIKWPHTLLLVILYVVAVVIHVETYTRLICSRLLLFLFTFVSFAPMRGRRCTLSCVCSRVWIEDSDMSLWFLFQMHIKHEDSVKSLLANSFRKGMDVLSPLHYQHEKTKCHPKVLF